MGKKIIIGLILFSITLFASNSLSALPTNFFTTESKLSTGKWIKIRVSETGVHEITSEQLSEMGFNDVTKVKIFGKGGYVLNEVLNEQLPDDLSQIPTLAYNNRIFFYANGSTEMSVKSITNNSYYIGKENTYSKYGYYFVTDSEKFTPLNIETTKTTEVENTSLLDNCYDYVYYNNNIFSFLCSGKTFYGENLLEDYNLSFTLNNRTEASPITLAFSIGSNVDETTSVSASINGSDIPLFSNSLAFTGSNKKFEICSPIGTANDIALNDNYSLKIDITDTGINSANLDYYSVTYIKDNIFPTDSTQMRMGFKQPESSQAATIKNIDETTFVWNVSKSSPKEHFILNTEKNTFPLSQNSWGQYIAFKPEKQQKSITIEKVVDNQNLHGLKTPDMVIICPKNLKEQAERLAEIHHSYDNLDVIVAEEEQIFNEFSSGTQDAMAYRLFMKMLYDRNPQKLRYLLLLGCGSYDNRRLNGGKSVNQLLTYQSNECSGLVSSYTTDDFFGFLQDGSGKSIPTDILSISIGRIPAKDIEEAKNAIDKISDYITCNDYDNWRSNILIISDQGDNDLHTSQAEGIEIIIDDALGGKRLNTEKIYQEWFTHTNLAENKSGIENDARDKFEHLLKEGLNYISYIGHAGAISFTHDNRLWNKAKVQRTKYAHLPFFSISACETAQFDNDTRCISEELVLTPEGGAIGVLAAARTVYSTQNDILNKHLAKIIFSLNENGEYHTMGEACMKAKKEFGTEYNYNKLSFTLFGDPAVKLRYPLNRSKISSINDISTETGDIKISPLSTMKISGEITKADGNIDESFNGKATITLFDKAVKFKDITSPNTKIVYPSFYPREKLCHETVSVINGKFTASMTVPANCLAANDSCLIRIFAKSNDNKIVSGSESRFTITEFNENSHINDNEAPVISEILIDGENAKNIIQTSANPVISFTVSDNHSISTKANDIQSAMKLLIDNSNIKSLSNYTTAQNGGKTVIGSLQLHDLLAGKHSLRLEVSDNAGNIAFKEFTFYVSEEKYNCELISSEEAVHSSVTLQLKTDYNVVSQHLIIKDNTNNIVLSKDIAGSSFDWDLRDNKGARVKPGRYTLLASFHNDEGYGVTKPIKIVVLKEE